MSKFRRKLRGFKVVEKYLETEICTGNVVNPWSGRDFIDKGNAVIELAIKVWRGIVVETYFNSE